jgi:hypothetical protein
MVLRASGTEPGFFLLHAERIMLLNLGVSSILLEEQATALANGLVVTPKWLELFRRRHKPRGVLGTRPWHE